MGLLTEAGHAPTAPEGARLCAFEADRGVEAAALRLRQRYVPSTGPGQLLHDREAEAGAGTGTPP